MALKTKINKQNPQDVSADLDDKEIIKTQETDSVVVTPQEPKNNREVQDDNAFHEIAEILTTLNEKDIDYFLNNVAIQWHAKKEEFIEKLDNIFEKRFSEIEKRKKAAESIVGALEKIK